MKSVLVLCALVVLTTAQDICSPPPAYTSIVGTTCDSTTSCLPELFCSKASSTASSGTCQLQAVVGTTCSSDSQCTPSAVGTLICVSGTCTYNYKYGGDTCTSSLECISGSCLGGKCSVMTAGSNCSSNTQSCGSDLLSCSGGVCVANVALAQTCGLINGTTIYCNKGLMCVNSASSSATTGTCSNLATEGEACVSSAFGGVTDAPVCDSTNKALYCTSGKCQSLTIASLGGKCDTTTNTACDPLTSLCINNVCVAYSTVPCNNTSSAFSSICKAGSCQCGADLTKSGVCIPPTNNVASACAIHALRNSQCIYSSGKISAGTQNQCASYGSSQRCCNRVYSGSQYVSNADLSTCSSGTIVQISSIGILIAVSIFFL